MLLMGVSCYMLGWASRAFTLLQQRTVQSWCGRRGWGALCVNLFTKCLGSIWYVLGFPGGSDGKESACNAGDRGLIPGLGRSPGGGSGNALQCSCLENPTDRGAWRAPVHGVAESQTRLSVQPGETPAREWPHGGLTPSARGPRPRRRLEASSWWAGGEGDGGETEQLTSSFPGPTISVLPWLQVCLRLL